MRFGINLRGDLAKIDLCEVESRMVQLLDEREVIFATSETMWGERARYQAGKSLPVGRGPLRARVFYKLISFFEFGFFSQGVARLYLIDCELKDLLDELRRRDNMVRRPAM